MTNDQRAHDLAIMITEFYLNHPEKAQGEISHVIPSNGNFVYDPYCLYKYAYNQTAKYVDEDFKE